MNEKIQGSVKLRQAAATAACGNYSCCHEQIMKSHADYIDALESDLLKQRRENETAFNHVNELLNERDEAIEQRDELAAALRNIAKGGHFVECPMALDASYVCLCGTDLANKALAKHEGGSDE